MGKLCLHVFLIILTNSLISGVYSSAKFTFVNNCAFTVWPGILSNTGIAPSTTGFSLQTGEFKVINAPSSWGGRFWGRTHCGVNSTGKFSCVTGDCGSGKTECAGGGAATAVTLAEFALDGFNGTDFYDVSLVDGFNLPMMVVPQGGSGANCTKTGCVGDLNSACPSELRVTIASGERVACKTACDAFGNDEFCCRGAYAGIQTCQSTQYSKFFKSACPYAYSYPFDDSTSTFTCTGTDYIITFCPSPNTILGPLLLLPQENHGFAPLQSPVEAPIYNTPQGNGSRKRHSFDLQKFAIGMALTIICIVTLSIVIIFFLKRRQSRVELNKEINQNVENFLLNHGSLAPKRYNYSEIKKITKFFNDKLGQGGYGSVYKGMLPDGCLVAVKLLSDTNSNANGEEFMNEVVSISRTSHVNIVNLLGFCYERNKRALVYEFMPNKSLDKFITPCCFEWKTLYKIAVGVARGLEYLHRGCNTRIVHFDIKPQNILLDEDFCPKISDFGLAKLCKKKQSILSVIGTRGTIGYIAPEVFSRNFGGVSHKSDVYSYGMMVLEMAGAKNFVGIGSNQSSENYFPDRIYEHIIPSETRDVDAFVTEEDEEITKKMFLVGFWCIQTIPLHRPSMSTVVDMLEGSLESIPIPPKPILFLPTVPEQKNSSSGSINVDTENTIEG